LAARLGGRLDPPVNGWIAGGLAVVMVAGVAPHILRMAYQSARRGILNQHVLLEIGAFAGITGGVIGLTGLLPDYPTAEFFAVSVLVATYHVFSEWLSLLVKTRSSQAIKKLLDLQPDLARLVQDRTESQVPVEGVQVGQHVRVRPGERIPLDGRIHSGYSAIDFSLVTGEPVPVERGPGQDVVGGAINTTGSLRIEVTATGAEGFLAQVATSRTPGRSSPASCIWSTGCCGSTPPPCSQFPRSPWPGGLQAAGCRPGSPTCAPRCSQRCRYW
jgi:cation transport ATPase